jgi:hypothetical protein
MQLQALAYPVTYKSTSEVVGSFSGLGVRRPPPGGIPTTIRLPAVCHWLCQCLATLIHPNVSNGNGNDDRCVAGGCLIPKHSPEWMQLRALA